jgi:septation ring formation regulator EzrA
MTTAQQKIQAFESAKKFGELFPGLLETLQEWAQIGSIQDVADRQVAESERRLAAAKSAEAQAKLERDAAAKRDVERLQTELDNISHKINAQNVTLQRAVERIELQNKQSIAQARAQVDTAADRVRELKKDAAEWQAKIDQAKINYAMVSSDLERKRAEHDKVKNVIAEALGRLGR